MIDRERDNRGMRRALINDPEHWRFRTAEARSIADEIES